MLFLICLHENRAAVIIFPPVSPVLLESTRPQSVLFWQIDFWIAKFCLRASVVHQYQQRSEMLQIKVKFPKELYMNSNKNTQERIWTLSKQALKQIKDVFVNLWSPFRPWSWWTTRSLWSTPRLSPRWPSCSASTCPRICSRTCHPTCPRACRSCAFTRTRSARSKRLPSRAWPTSLSWVWR